MSLSCAGLKTQIPMHSNSLGCFKIFALSSPVLYWFRIWHASRVWKRKTSEKRRFTLSSKYPDTTNTFSLFLDEFLETDLWPIYCSLTSLVTLRQLSSSGKKKQSSQLRRFCAGYFSAYSTGRYLLVIFKSDDTVEGRGFKFRYFAVSKNPPTTPSTSECLLSIGFSLLLLAP